MSRRVVLALALPLALAMLSGSVSSQPKFTREPGLDRSGNDIERRLLAPDAGLEACEALCASNAGCRAYTFVKRSTTVPEPICWLKDTVPVGYPSSCCTSGVRLPAKP